MKQAEKALVKENNDLVRHIEGLKDHMAIVNKPRIRLLEFDIPPQVSLFQYHSVYNSDQNRS